MEIDTRNRDGAEQLIADQAERIRQLEAKVAQLSGDAGDQPAPARQDGFYVDPLTGLYSHAYFLQVLDKEVAKSRRYGNPLSGLYVDIDGLDEVNRRYGYDAGDLVVQAVARCIRETVRTCDTVAQLSGEEFALVLPETDEEGAAISAERIRGAVCRLQVPELDGFFLTVSIGIAGLTPREAAPGAFLDRVKGALRGAKDLGRNTCFRAVVTEDPDEATPRRPGYGTIDALLAVLAAKDSYTHTHSHHVGYYADRLAVALALTAKQREIVRLAGVLHDLGKIGIPDAILQKEGSLTAEEYAVVKQHPVTGHDIVSSTQQLGELLPAILYHHERWDGGGYPNGLAAEEIPLEARIVCVADAYDAMTTDRPYRKRLPQEAAIAELRRCAGTQFDRRVVDAMLDVLDREGEAGVETSVPAAKF